ncbi:MAG: hypothetical protein JWM65_2798 [Sphingomonas bacterium]|nr:hypothetical protein [Sphingomonas bacterium]
MVQCMRTAAAIVAALIVAAPAAAQTGASAWEPARPELSPDEVAWHVRAGLNVAALACRDADAATMVAQYNAMLTNDGAPLAAARAGVESAYRLRFGAAWQARDDDDMTRLYNHFATPEAHDAFCATARELLRDSETVAPGEFYAFARYALPQLEQAFAPARGFGERPSFTLAASEDMPRVGLATNARVPLAPVGEQPAAPVIDPQPGFQDER